ncbi:MAG: hypothetical protein AVO33_01925 [delta proteobacterium ML8_F1]|nr:MAG: hypothetical protein AVO33_01925 [delta proteobacterium ML8_F1]
MLRIQILNTPRVTSGDTPVKFPYRKAEALFYYLALMKQTNRNHLAALLWWDESEETARKNLRQTLYVLKKTFDFQVIESTDRSNLLFNPEVPCVLDIDEWLNNPETLTQPGAVRVFSGFFVKDAPLFNEWLGEKSAELEQSILQSLEKAFHLAYRQEEWALCEKLAKAMVATDEYHEAAYRFLIDVYGLQKKIYKMQQTFEKFRRLLLRELGVEPSEELRRVFNSHMNQKKDEISGEDFFFGRDRELDLFDTLQKKHAENSLKTVILVSGASGEGKTTLIHRMLSRLDAPVIETHCYEAERHQAYRPLRSLFKGLLDTSGNRSLKPAHLQVLNTYFPGIQHQPIPPSGLSPDLSRENLDLVLLEILEALLDNRTWWFAVDDAQWLDPFSLSFISTLIHYGPGSLGILIGSRTPAEALFKDSSRQAYFHHFPLKPLDFAQMQHFVRAHPHGVTLTAQEQIQLYEASKGNLFLVNSGILVKSTHPDITIEKAVYHELLKSRLQGLEDLDKNILEGLSLFFDYPDIYRLCELLAIDLMDFFNRIEVLKRLKLLKEQIIQNELKLTFSHHLIRDEIYNQMSLGKKKILHLKIARLIEEKLRNESRDRFYYPQLIYHFERSLEPERALKFKILNLDIFFNYTHELYPVLKDGILEDLPGPFPSQDIPQMLTALEKELDATSSLAGGEDPRLLKILLNHMKGRFLIKEGHYREGNQCILAMLKSAKDLESPDYFILGCRQMIYSGIQNHDLDMMDRYINLGIQKAREAAYPYDEAIFKRLRGLYCFLSNDHIQAQENLKDSLATLKTYPDRKYDLHQAAALNYLGEIERSRGDLEGALKWYNEALSLYSELNTTRGMAPILTNKALVYFQTDEFTAAASTIDQAMTIFEKSRTVWKKATALALKSHLEDKLQGKSFTAAGYSEILELASKIGNPEEIAFVKSLDPGKA